MKRAEEVSILKGKNNPKIDKIFDSFKKRVILVVKVSPPKNLKLKKPWFLELKINSIELLANCHDLIDEGVGIWQHYRLTANLVSLNGEENLKNLQEKEGGLDKKLELFLSTSGAITVVLRSCEVK